jgi:hypothetical protein
VVNKLEEELEPDEWKAIRITTKGLPKVTGVEGSKVSIIGEITLPISRLKRQTKEVTFFITDSKMGMTKVICGTAAMRMLIMALYDEEVGKIVRFEYDSESDEYSNAPKTEVIETMEELKDESKEVVKLNGCDVTVKTGNRTSTRF